MVIVLYRIRPLGVPLNTMMRSTMIGRSALGCVSDFKSETVRNLIRVFSGSQVWYKTTFRGISSIVEWNIANVHTSGQNRHTAPFLEVKAQSVMMGKSSLISLIKGVFKMT